MGFSVDAPFIKDILDQIGKGDIQLPDFQRGWVWDDPHITSLIASISLSYPIGAVMFLEAGGVAFKPRLFEGVLLAPPPAPCSSTVSGEPGGVARLNSVEVQLGRLFPFEHSVPGALVPARLPEPL